MEERDGREERGNYKPRFGFESNGPHGHNMPHSNRGHVRQAVSYTRTRLSVDIISARAHRTVQPQAGNVGIGNLVFAAQAIVETQTFITSARPD